MVQVLQQTASTVIRSKPPVHMIAACNTLQVLVARLEGEQAQLRQQLQQSQAQSNAALQVRRCLLPAEQSTLMPTVPCLQKPPARINNAQVVLAWT